MSDAIAGLSICAAAILAVVARCLLARRGGPTWPVTVALLVLCVAASSTFLAKPFRDCVVRARCTPFHYAIGSKYFDELGYSGIYRFTALAGEETSVFDPRTCGTIRDLHDYRYVPAAQVLEEGRAMREAAFSDARWEEFKSDIRALGTRRSARTFCNSLKDHGFNPPPAWNLVPGRLIRLVDFHDAGEWRLVLSTDLLMLTIALAVVALWVSLDAALLVYLFAATAWWNEGHQLGTWFGFAWLACSLVATAAWQRGRPALAGVLIGIAASFRVFPLLLLSGPGLLLSRSLWQRSIDRAALRLFTAFSVTCLALLVLGLSEGGVERTKDWIGHIGLHGDTIRYEANKFGLRLAVSDTPFAPSPSEAARRAAVEGQPVAMALLIAGLLGLAGAAVLRPGGREWAIPLSVVAIVVLLTLSRYYYLVFATMLLPPRSSHGSAVVAVGAASLFAVNAVFFAAVEANLPFRAIYSAGTIAFVVAAAALPVAVLVASRRADAISR
jgi:hypothetical protein